LATDLLIKENEMDLLLVTLLGDLLRQMSGNLQRVRIHATESALSFHARANTHTHTPTNKQMNKQPNITKKAYVYKRFRM